MYWTIKTFKTLEQKNKFIENNKSKYQIVEIFINNGYGLEIKKLRKVY